MFCRSKSVLAVTKVLSQQDYVCRDEHTFDMTKLLSWQTCVCRDEHTSVTTKDLFVCNKHMFVTTKVSLLQQKYLSQQNFCCNKNMSQQNICCDNTYFRCNKRCVLSCQTCLSRQKCRLSQQKLYLWQLPPMIKALLDQWSAWWIVSLHLW